MLSRTKIALSVALVLGSASATLAMDQNGKAHHGTRVVRHQMPVASPAARAARAEVRDQRVVKPSSDFERIWFRAAQGPEWDSAN